MASRLATASTLPMTSSLLSHVGGAVATATMLAADPITPKPNNAVKAAEFVCARSAPRPPQMTANPVSNRSGDRQRININPSPDPIAPPTDTKIHVTWLSKCSAPRPSRKPNRRALRQE